MKWALNTKKGTVINHPEVKLEGGTAIEVEDKVANQVKHLYNVVIFDGFKPNGLKTSKQEG